MSTLKSLVFLGALAFAAAAHAHNPTTDANTGLPTCLDNKGHVLAVNDSQVLQWKDSSPDQFHARGYVSGTVDQVFPDATGHVHYSLRIGPNPSDHVEIIYNASFGQMPEPKIGEASSVCGDYITANNTGRNPSPDGALIHWVHKSDNPGAHPSGFVVLGGQLYGEGNGTGN